MVSASLAGRFSIRVCGAFDVRYEREKKCPFSPSPRVARGSVVVGRRQRFWDIGRRIRESADESYI